MSDIWIVLVEDRHADIEVLAFSTEERAVQFAREQAQVNAAHPERITEQDVNHEGGCILWIDYSVESEHTDSDRVTVFRRTVDTEQ